jgi:hypothetical protein
MKDEILFGGLSVAFTCLLLLVRHLFLKGLNGRRNHFYKIKSDDGGSSNTGDPRNQKPASLLIISPRLSLTKPATDEWPSEIVVSSEFFCKR